MRRIHRSTAVLLLLLLGSAACAHDGMLAPEIAPEPQEAVLTAAPAAEAAPDDGMGSIRIDCVRVPNASRGVPLHVVDGVMMDAPPTALDAMDVHEIQVIKGAAAVRMFGSRAEHGVILVTTRPPTARRRS